jgi:hypothetical protein
MPRRQAIDIALDAQAKPGITSFLSAGPLPEGLKCLLRIVAEGEWRDASTEHVYSRHSPEAVRAASAAFLSEVLFTRQTDPYRVLGLPPGAPLRDVREHKRMLLKWLHPDRNPEAREKQHLARVIEASESIESGRSHCFGRLAGPQPSLELTPPAAEAARDKRSAVPHEKEILTVIARAARQAANRSVPRLLRALKLSSSFIALLLSILITWRYVMDEPIGASVARYSELALGMITWP